MKSITLENLPKELEKSMSKIQNHIVEKFEERRILAETRTREFIEAKIKEEGIEFGNITQAEYDAVVNKYQKEIKQICEEILKVKSI